MSLNPIKNPSNLKGKIAVVTGGGQGIGKALAKELCKYGATVAISDLSKEKAFSAAKDLDNISFKCDVTQEKEIKILVSKVKKIFGNNDA